MTIYRFILIISEIESAKIFFPGLGNFEAREPHNQCSNFWWIEICWSAFGFWHNYNGWVYSSDVIHWPKENNDYSFIFITEGTMWRVLAWVLSLLQYFWMCGGIDSDRVGRWILVTAQFKIFAILWLLYNLNKFSGGIVNILPVLFAKMKPCISEVRSKLK